MKMDVYILSSNEVAHQTAEPETIISASRLPSR